ncbi:discoidin, CUB and LCCL domain-containing protein 2-like isoform X1 [Polyodon spathula]|uniref:discoidin, CUB and LCCL domain-containing protein 2-like isoform X1 n=1 Tax=Polyodon spathula TaxID=7913 RepID=UPI001B7E25CD|nr:discoidin, CUB and LCCL domain-containing protein 2-like isoform X1 [Polyodon spathula]
MFACSLLTDPRRESLYCTIGVPVMQSPLAPVVFNLVLYFPGDGCGHTLLGPNSGTLSSINYPQTYPNGTVCEWEIRVRPGERVTFKFADFDIEDSDSCHFNYLRIYNGIGPTRTEIGKYCGLGVQWDHLIGSAGNEVTVQFMSGTHVSGRGFLLSYSTTDHPDLITCLDKGSHFTEPEFSKYCPAGCLTAFGEISGTIPHGYRDSSLLCRAGIHAGVVSNVLGGQINVVNSKGIPYYEGSLANNVTSKVGPLSASLFTFKTNGCYGTLGLESGVIRNAQITASTVLQWEHRNGQPTVWGPEGARLKKPGPPWAALDTNEHQWLQVDLKKEKRITGISTTGSTMSDYSYVSGYRVLYSEDGKNWNVFREANADHDKIFQGNVNYFQEVRNNFIPPIEARYVRINPLQWHQKIAMKVELLGCQPSSGRAPMHTPLPKISTDFPVQLHKTTFTPDIRNTTVTPSGTKDVALAAVLVPVLVMGLTALILVLVCAWHWRNRKQTAEGTYDLPYWDRPGWWKGMKQFLPAKGPEVEESLVRYSSTEVSRLRARDVGPLLQTAKAEYAQPLVGGVVGTLRQRSTFKPGEGVDSSYVDPDPYDAPLQEIYHAYAEPLPASGAEYATPIIMDISSHLAGTVSQPPISTFKSPGSTLLSRTDSSVSTGHVQYDTPKGTHSPTPAAEELVYQVPQSSVQKGLTMADKCESRVGEKKIVSNEF